MSLSNAASSPIITLPTDGVTDIGPLVQAAYDSGRNIIKLLASTTYVWNTSVFLDRTNDTFGGLVIDGNRATIKLGTNLATSTWSRDTTTTFAVFPNTKRSALSGGAVSVVDANRATGSSAGALKTLTVRDVTIDGGGNNRGFAFSNRTTIWLENVIVYGARVGATWFSYTDQNTFINCYSRTYSGSLPAGQVVFEQYVQGDGVMVMGGKADSGSMFAKLSLNRGSVFNGLVTTNLAFTECTGVSFSGLHLEEQNSPNIGMTIKGSNVTFNDSVFYETYTSNLPAISVDDSTIDARAASEVIFNNCVGVQLMTFDVVSTQFSPFLSVDGLNDNTRIIARNLKGMVATTDLSGHWAATVQPLIVAPGSTSVQTALSSARGRSAVASGNFEIRSSAVYTDGSYEQMLVTNRLTAPTISNITSGTTFSSGGTLTNGTIYSYAITLSDSLGNSTDVSAESTVTAGANGVIRLQIASTSMYGALTVYRSTGNGASATPDSYIVIPIRSRRTILYDAGAVLSGRPWITTSIPTPSTTNATVSKVTVNGTALATTADVSAAVSSAGNGASSASDLSVVDYGLYAWAINPITTTSSSNLTSGTFRIAKAKVGNAGTPTSAIINITTATSVSTTLFKIAVYAADGTQIGSLSNTTTGGSTGLSTLPITMNRALVAGEVIYLGMIWVGSGTLALSGTPTMGAINIGLSATQNSMYRVSTLTGLSDAPSTIVFSSYNAAGTVNEVVLK